MEDPCFTVLNLPNVTNVTALLSSGEIVDDNPKIQSHAQPYYIKY